jgi:hypothetical protein
MIVYRAAQRTIRPMEQLESLRERISRARLGPPLSLDKVTSLLIDIGELESGCQDAANPVRDDVPHPALNSASLTMGRLFWHTWNRMRSADRAAVLATVGAELDRIAGPELPQGISVSLAEGFAWYALYPESYIVAASRALHTIDPPSATVIGLRNIGCTLSAVVAATVHEHGIPVRRFTVRPRGHPFDRQIHLTHSLASQLTREQGCFLIVDEGPGLSGSSLTSVAATLSSLGIPDDRIVFLPAWDPEPQALNSEAARQHWIRHRRVVASFQDVVLAGQEAPVPRAAGDISGGRWRHRSFPSEAEYPPVQPSHERRKFLLEATGIDRLFKFAGLGHYGEATLRRALLLHAGGFTPAPGALRRGFIEWEYHAGRPLRPKDRSDELVRHAARYIGFRAKVLPADRGTSCHDLAAMANANFSEAFGEHNPITVQAEEQLDSAPAALVDGRMQPYEWLRRPDGKLLKTDAVDHCDDHFLPGGADPAWDLAGLSVEFELEPDLEAVMLREYSRCTGDIWASSRLHFYRLCYLGFRVGYCDEGTRAIPFARPSSCFRTFVPALTHVA